MTWNLLASAVTAGNSGTTNTSSAINTTGSDFIIVCVTDNDGNAIGTLSDSVGNSWPASPDINMNNSAGGGQRCMIWSLHNPITNASHTFTYAASPGSNFAPIGVLAFSGSAASPLDKTHISANNAGTLTTLDCGSITPTQNNELIISVCGLNGAPTSPSINTGNLQLNQPGIGATSFAMFVAYYVQAGAAPIDETFSWTGAVNAGACVASYIGVAAPVQVILQGFESFF